MKKLLLALAVLLSSLITLATAGATEPTQDKTAVLQVVQQFFDAMHARDAAGIGAIWQPGTQFAFGKPGKDGYVVAQESIEQLTAGLQQSSVGWLERVWNPTVLVEGRMAVVWARYDFHVGDKFTHNGTDCYTLLKTDSGWKIVGLVFTVEPGTKTENPSGPPH